MGFIFSNTTNGNNENSHDLNNNENTDVITDITEYLDEYFLKNETSDEKSEDSLLLDESELIYEKEKEKFIGADNSYLTNNLFECDIACLTCDKTKEKSNNNCFECNSKEGYYPIYDSISNCYSIETISKNYYLNVNESFYSWKKCYEKCETCNTGGNITNMNCLSCKKNSNTSVILTENGNCINICLNNTYIIPDGYCVPSCPNGTYQYSLNNSCLESCPNNYKINNNKCIIKSFDKNITVEDFKNQIINDIASFVNSSKVINSSNFLAVVLSSDNMDPEEQLKNGISAFDLGNCTNVLKEYYEISEQENLIIMNMEIKYDKNESDTSNKNSLNFEKNTQLEVYDNSGQKLNLSICEEDIKIMKYIGDINELNINSAKTLSNQGIDIFNSNDEFFNDICNFYDSSDGKDIILSDRRNDIFQNVTFCQNGCTYNGMNYDLMVANCICKSNILQEGESNLSGNNKDSELNYKTLSKTFLENLFNFDFEVLRCHNLVFNTKILVHNIGFYCLLIMLILQIIFIFIYLIKGLNSLKYFMLNFEKKIKNKNKNKNHINIINKKRYKYPNNKKNVKKNYKATPPQKNKKKRKVFNYSNKGIKNELNNIKVYKKQNNNNIIELNSKRQIIPENYDKNKEQFYQLNFKLFSNSSKSLYISNSLENNILIDDIYNKKNSNDINNLYENIQLVINLENKENNYIFNMKQNEQVPNHHMKKKANKLFEAIHYLQDMDYKDAISYDKRGYLQIFWGYLVDSQIILGTFCTDNYLDLFSIKLSFFVFTFQISFFLNALFYTDEYISCAYHNNGVLDLLTGLPKIIYSLIVTLMITNLLRMLSTSKNELKKLIIEKRKYNNYIYLIHLKLIKLGKKLVIYIILVYIFSLFFLYYVSAFCAVYRNSQKYWFYGCLESFGMDSLVTIGICIFLALLRYISIKKNIKCFYITANLITTFL